MSGTDQHVIRMRDGSIDIAPQIPPRYFTGNPDAEHECCHHAQAARAVCRERERELLELKGACSNSGCRLHYAHSGPCDEERSPQ